MAPAGTRGEAGADGQRVQRLRPPAAYLAGLLLWLDDEGGLGVGLQETSKQVRSQNAQTEPIRSGWKEGTDQLPEPHGHLPVGLEQRSH